MMYRFLLLPFVLTRTSAVFRHVGCLHFPVTTMFVPGTTNPPPADARVIFTTSSIGTFDLNAVHAQRFPSG